MRALLRLAGLALLLAACTGGGMALSLGRRRVWRQLYTFTALLEYLRAGIRYQALPCTILLAQAADDPRFDGLGLEDCRDFADIPLPPALGPALCAQAEQTLAMLATSPRQPACASLTRLLEGCRARQQQLDRAAEEAGRLYPRLGLCLGLLLALLLW